MRTIRVSGAVVLIAVAAALGVPCLAQQKPVSRLAYYDHEGKQISNNEFVDIRQANFNYPDATIIKTLDDGTQEFRLQKVAQEGMLAPDVTVRTIEGKDIVMSSLRGKVVVLHFWFIGCAVCRAMKPQLNDFKKRFTGDEDVVFLAMTEDREGDVEDFLKKVPSDYLNAADAKPAMSQFSFRGFPKNIVIDKQGKIVYWRSSIKAWGKFESVVRSELARH